LGTEGGKEEVASGEWRVASKKELTQRTRREERRGHGELGGQEVSGVEGDGSIGVAQGVGGSQEATR